MWGSNHFHAFNEFPNSTAGYCWGGKKGFSSGRFEVQQEETTTQAPQLDGFKGLAELLMSHLLVPGMKNIPYMWEVGAVLHGIPIPGVGAVISTPAATLRGSSDPHWHHQCSLIKIFPQPSEITQTLPGIPLLPHLQTSAEEFSVSTRAANRRELTSF